MKRIAAAQLEAAIKRLEEVVKNPMPEERTLRVLGDLQNLRVLAKLSRIYEATARQRRAATIADLLKRAKKIPPAQ